MFRLKSLWVNGFKNLNNFNINFDSKDGVIVLIGNNASGKSNLLEAISAIFTGLYNAKLDELNFKFNLIYEMHDTDIRISKKQKVRYRIKKPTNTGWLESENFYELGLALSKKTTPQSLLDYKPSQVIALYSGEELRLWERYYQDFYYEFFNSIKNNNKKTPELLYINKYVWDIALITLLCNEKSTVFLQKLLDIDMQNGVEINFTIDNSKYKKFEDNTALELIRRIKIEQENNQSINTKTLASFDIGNQAIKPKEIFEYLYITSSPTTKNKKVKIDKIITKININLPNKITLKDLSEGQKKQILLRLALDVLADENSLLLFDEPDAHIHISNKKLIPNLLQKYEGRRNVVLTTHSPTLAHSFNNHNLRYLDNGKIDENYNKKEQIIKNLSNGFMGVSETQILLQSNKDIILLVEGKTDKVHIETAFEKLKSDYNELEFDIFSIGYASHLANFISGLKTSELAKDKTYIAIFDYDQTGRGFSKIVKNKKSGKIKNFCRYPNTNIYELFICSQDHINNKTKENFEIENMYPIEKQKEIYKKAIDGSDNLNDVEQTYKNLLAKHCSSFDKSNFDGFKTLFDKILEIKNS
jgi:ABC-type cobalamin/Fe3+-siderophores transport system ATPase subunit